MKLGFFTSIIADGHPTTGFEIANEAVLGGLRELGHDVTVFGFKLPRQSLPEDPRVHVLESINLENAQASRWKKVEWIGRALMQSLPIAAAKLTCVSSEKLKQVVDEAGPFDAYIFNSYQMAAAFPEFLTERYGYISHNVEHRSALENVVSAPSAFERYLYQRDARLLEKFENRICKNADFVWALSEDDLSVFQPVLKNGSVLPLVVPVAPEPKPDAEKIWDVGLIGTWSWQPNAIGLHWFLQEVVPHLPDNLTIAVAGTLPTGFVKASEQVEFLGRVDDAAEFLESVRVVPLVSRGGTGVQLKTIEAFQSGHACVATRSSLRGIEELPANCLEADDPQEFANNTDELVRASVNNNLKNTSGSSFYDRQKRAMLGSLALGIEHLEINHLRT